MMTRKTAVLFVLALVLVVAPKSYAQTAATTTASATTIQASPTPAKAVAANGNSAVDAATKLKQQAQLIQDQKRTTSPAQVVREDFKNKLQTIRDQKKKVLVERIDTKLAEVNKRMTAKFLETLSRLQEFLNKIKVATTEPRVLADIDIAQKSLDLAKSAVEVQAEKVYTMQITDDVTLKTNAGTIVSQVRQDLSAIHKLVVDAKQALQKLNADRVLIKKENKEATVSAK